MFRFGINLKKNYKREGALKIFIAPINMVDNTIKKLYTLFTFSMMLAGSKETVSGEIPENLLD